MFMITQITDLVLLIVLKIVNKLFVQKTSFPFHYPLSLEFFFLILRFYRLHEACYGGFSLIRDSVQANTLLESDLRSISVQAKDRKCLKVKTVNRTKKNRTVKAIQVDKNCRLFLKRVPDENKSLDVVQIATRKKKPAGNSVSVHIWRQLVLQVEWQREGEPYQ